MGNKSQTKKNQHNNQFVMNLQNQKIILIKDLSLSLTIGELEVFPHGLDGLKLWDAGIMLTRYIIINCNIFKDKEVLELGSGVGISGIALKKWTQCKSVTMSDYHPSVIDNINKNCQKNDILAGVTTIQLDWRDRNKYNQQFDVIVGSDIVYFGCPVQDLYQVFKKFLKVGGKGIIVIPDRKNYAQLFLNQIQKQCFSYEIEELSDPRYSQPALENEEASLKAYPLLKSIKFFVYKLTKN